MSVRSVDVAIPGSAAESYPIIIGDGLIGRLPEFIDLSQYSRVFIAADSNVAPLWADRLQRALPAASRTIIVPAGEAHKGVSALEEIWKGLLAGRADRRSLLLNLGGGVIGDLGGFAAATYMRGIDFVQLPTTLLAQVDASIGGKVAIDFAGVKNLVGNFAQPRLVLIAAETLATLPERELTAGFAEIIKHGLICDKRYLDLISGKPARSYSSAELMQLIEGSCRIKAGIVAEDPHERGRRKLLNFGHTIGHAVEALALQSPAPLLHGEAISIGICLECRLAVRAGLLPPSDVKAIDALLAGVGLPTKWKFDGSTEALLSIMASDKKSSFGAIRWSLLKGIGQGVFDQLVEPQMVLETLLHEIDGIRR